MKTITTTDNINDDLPAGKLRQGSGTRRTLTTALVLLLTAWHCPLFSPAPDLNQETVKALYSSPPERTESKCGSCSLIWSDPEPSFFFSTHKP